MKRDWTTVPCVRESFLFSIPSSILLGISRFMLTSTLKTVLWTRLTKHSKGKVHNSFFNLFVGNVPKSTNLSVFSFCGITLATWVVCRINLVNEQFKVKQLQEGVKNYIEKIGTKDDKSK